MSVQEPDQTPGTPVSPQQKGPPERVIQPTARLGVGPKADFRVGEEFGTAKRDLPSDRGVSDS